MTTTHIKKGVVLLFVLAGLITQALPTARTNSQPTPPTSTQQPLTINISPRVPSDITPPATLQSAAVFAWQEFIALNWPAVPQTGRLNTRDTPDPNRKLGDPGYTGPLVWHTFRGKVEIFPGVGGPPGFVNNAAASYGYDAPPKYVYSPLPPAPPPMEGGVGTPTGQVLPFRFGPIGPPPWINLDENSEIGVTTMYAGIGPQAPVPGEMIIFMAKANRTEYNYVAARGWWTQLLGSRVDRDTAINNTVTYLQNNQRDPPPGSNDSVSFPNGTIEVKAAWRRLTPTEMKSKRFYTTRVRYYRTIKGGPNDGKPGYVDAVFGLLALHIIQKTPSAPYFIYATFSQADNLLDVHGRRVEDENGRLQINQGANPTDPLVVSQNATSANPATPSSVQHFTPLTSNTQPQNRLYYINTPSPPLPPNPPNIQGKVALNRRINNIPQEIIGVNRLAHTAIAAYNRREGIPSSPWLYYKLVNVQYEPYDKPPGITYQGIPGGPHPSTYYQANEVVESDYTLQVFSGQFQPNLPPPNDNFNTGNLITDYNLDGTTFKNVSYNGNGYLMGGCMGCHGNIQQRGFDFSFIFAGGPVLSPETENPATSLKKFVKLFAKP